MSKINGYKTYILAALGIIYAVSGFLTGNLDANSAFELIIGSGAFATLRHSISQQ